MTTSRRLFVNTQEPGTAYAYLGINHGDMARRLYCSGFFEAAEHLLRASAANQLPVDTCFYPAVFLFRHGLELAIKEMLASVWALNRSEGDPPLKHGLQKLWQSLRPELEAYFEVYPDTHTADGCEVEGLPLDDLDEVLAELNDLDPTGQAFRYPLDAKGARNLTALDSVNLAHLLRETTRVSTAVDRWQRKLNDHWMSEKWLAVALAKKSKP